MVNIWKYDGMSFPVTIKTNDGEQFTGSVICVNDADEEEPEDNITLEMKNGRIISFYPSEIETIDVVEK